VKVAIWDELASSEDMVPDDDDDDDGHKEAGDKVSIAEELVLSAEATSPKGEGDKVLQ